MSSSNKICYGLCAIVILAAIVPYVGLIPAGHWQDEFYNFSRLHDCGLSYLLTRLGWSLRPFSELLVFAYAEAVLTTNRPLVESALMLIWLITALIMFAVPARFAASSRTLVMLASAAIGALFLLDHPTAEMFYWPMASFAYMPTIAAIVAVCWLAVLDGIVSSNTRRTAAILLIVAASSLEIGAMFVVCMTGIAGVVFTISAYRREWRNTAWLIGPFIISAGILALMYAGRVSHGKELMGNAAIVHHIQPALKLAIIPFFKTALSSDWATRSNLSIALAMIGKAFTFAAFYGIARVISRNGKDFFHDQLSKAANCPGTEQRKNRIYPMADHTLFDLFCYGISHHSSLSISIWHSRL